MAGANLPPDSVSKPSPLDIPRPPRLHTRASNDSYVDRPSTPTQYTSHGFTSPAQTPTGSPSKSKLPPGAVNLPNVFDKAMKLAPSSPTKFGFSPPSSPGKGGVSALDDINENTSHKERYQSPGSPTRRQNKENASPSVPRRGKDWGTTPASAAVSRYEQYHSRESDGVRRTQAQTQRGLTAEEMEKLQLPNVKRLANVTQLCRYLVIFSTNPDANRWQISLTIISIS